MLVNAWIGIPEDDHNELNNRRGTENNTGPAKYIVDGQLDPAVVQNLYKTRTQGQNILHLWSVILDDRNGPINQQINEFRQEFPGARVEGVWLEDGTEFLDENGLPAYEQGDNILGYMPDIDGQPATQVSDVNLPFGWAPRTFT